MGYTEFNGYQNGSSGQYTIHLNCTYSSNGSNANTSNVYMTLSFMRSDYSSYWYNETGSAYVEFWCDGQHYKENFNINLNYNAGQWYQIGPGHTFVVPHNNDGTKSCEVRAYAYIGIAPDNVVVDAHTLTLDRIPRYANFTTGVDNRTMTSARIKWSADAHISEGQYYLDGQTTAASITTNGTSGTFTVSGLQPNTSHNVKIRLKRSDSGLWTEKTASFTTLAGASIGSVPAWTLPAAAGSITLNISNPGKGYIRLFFYTNVGGTVSSNVVVKTLSGIISGNTTLSFTEAEVNQFYAKAPNSAAGKYCVYVRTYASQANANNNTSSLSTTQSSWGAFTIVSSDATKPAVSASMLSVYDNNNAYGYFTTPDNTRFVQSLSAVCAKVTAAATAKKSASIPAKAYKITFNGRTESQLDVNSIASFGLAPTAQTYSVTLTVTDSRGFANSVSKNITVYQYFEPSGNITLKRQNDFEAPTTLAFSGTYAVVNNQNTIKSIQYRYGETIAAKDAAAWTDITAKATVAEGKINIPAFSVGNFEINKTYEFEVQMSDDKNTILRNRTLTQGVPILSIGNNGRVGINCLPTDSAAITNSSTRLQVNGAVKAYSFNGMRGIATSTGTASDEYAASSKLTNSLNSSLTKLDNNLKSIGKTLFPVGSIFFTTKNTNPGTFIGGTWVAWGSGRVPVGVNTSDGNFNTPEKTGGASSHSHTVNAHSHSTPSHRHGFTVGWYDWYASAAGITSYASSKGKFQTASDSGVFANSLYGGNISVNGALTNWATTHNPTIYKSDGDTTAVSAGNTGNSSPATNSQSNLQPYITCYMWKRTA